MKETHLPLLKFKCENKECQFECFINRNNNVLTTYSRDFAVLLDWKCPECEGGNLRFAATNTKFDFSLKKETRPEEGELSNLDPEAKIIDPND